MSAVLCIDRSAPGALKLNAVPQQKFWFDPPATRPTLEAERRHRQERLAGAFRIFARHGFDLGLAGHITARDPELTDHFWVNPLGVHFSQHFGKPLGRCGQAMQGDGRHGNAAQ